MILVDTSMWIELLSGRRKFSLGDEVLFEFVTCGPVVQEVLQGIRNHSAASAFRASFMALPVLSDPLPLRLFESAAEFYRRGPEKGYTIRSSVDCLIAAIAIENDAPVWHQDRDFDILARFTTLRIFTF